MLKSLKIQNFESWKDIEIDFHPGINVLVGESDKGKSGILRCLEWIFDNTSGFSCRSDFVENKKELTFGEVTFFDSDHVIRRQRNEAGVNEYLLNGEPLTALKTDVPDEILEISKITDINIQGQHPSKQYFLLADKPGSVAKKFNKVTGISILDKATSETNSQIRGKKAELKVVEKEIEKKENQIQEKEWIEKAFIFSKKLEKLIQDIEKEEETLQTLNTILQNLKQVQEKIDKSEQIPKSLNVIKKIIQLETQISVKEQEQKSLKNLIFQINKTVLSINAMQSIQKALNMLKSIVKLDQNITTKNQNRNHLRNILLMVSENKDALHKKSQEWKNAEKVFQEKIRTETCPTCGRSNGSGDCRNNM